MTALSGQTPKQLSHSKQLPQERQRRASKSAFSSVRPSTTSSKVLCRRARSSSGRFVRGASEKYQVLRSSNSPVGWGKPSSSRRIFSNTRRSSSKLFTVESQRIVIPSSSASSSSSPVSYTHLRAHETVL